MKNYMKTILNGIQSWTKKEIKDSTADWNQNDTTADNFIKNRTHWEDSSEIVLVDNLTLDEYQSGNAPGCNFIPGQSYTVVWNGVRYDNLICIYDGEFNVIATPNDGYPFYIDDDGGDGLYIESVDDETFTVSIMTIETVIHKLDPKYIKDMYHEKIVELFHVENAKFEDGGFICEPGFPIVDGNTYVVNWDGVEYTCEAYIFEGLPAIGSTVEFGGKGNGEPFAIGYNRAENITFIYNFDDLTTHTFSVTEVTCITILPKYIKDMYYEESTMTMIKQPISINCNTATTYDDTSCYSGNAYAYWISGWSQFVGKNIRVVFDGQPYDVAIDDDQYMADLHNYPFALYETQDRVYFYVLESGTHTFEFYSIEKNIHYIDPKYIKDMYCEIDKSTHLSIVESTGHASGYTSYKVGPYAWDIEKELTICIDGVTYTFNEFINDGYTNALGMYRYRIGAPYASGSITDSSEYPFVIIVFVGTEEIEEYAHIEFADGTDNHTVKIPLIEIKTIDEKYISDTIARVEDVAIGFEEFATEFDLMKMNATDPVGTGSFSMNRKTDTTIGNYSHAEGKDTTASGQASHAEGYYTKATNNFTHAEGVNTTASGVYSHAEGSNTLASGSISHAEGYYVIAASTNQHAQGKYNLQNSDNTLAHIVGNGTSTTARSNAHTLDWEGNAWFAGDVYVGSTSGTNRDDGSERLLKMSDKATDDDALNLMMELGYLPALMTTSDDIIYTNSDGVIYTL